MFWFEEMPLCAFDWWRRVGFVYPAVLIFGCFSAFAYGACLGSFINVCIWRMPRRESVVSAPSHCTSCGALIRWFDNLPVISFILLRGRCRKCHERYSARYFLVEVLTGVLFAGILVKTGLAGQVPGIIYFYCVAVLFAICAAWIDAEHRIIPDALNYPVMILALAGAMIFPEVWGESTFWKSAGLSLLSGVIPGAFLAIFAFAGKIIASKEVMGMGDVKFITAAGMLIGLPGALFTLLTGSLSGIIYGVVKMLFSKENKSDPAIPFAPFMAAGVLLWIFCGDFLLHWFRSITHAG